MSTKSELLALFLAIAVPLWIKDLRPLGMEAILLRMKELKTAEIRDGMPLIGAEELFFSSKKPGDTAKAFNAAAEAIACMSFLPGGITIFGGHWETQI